VGREADIDALCGLLSEPGVRLLTLVGPGGVGKTRLALAAAEEMLGEHPGGVYLVDLAPVTDAEHVIPAIAAVLGVREASGTPLTATLKQHLRDRRVLLVLDNFEQVIPAGKMVAELAEGCPGLTMLVTSRAPLRVRMEHEYPVPPLSMPEARQGLSVAALSQYGAIALFVQRAGAVEPGFTLTEDNAGAVVEVCRRVDGLPLALELVAAHTRLLSPQSILARLKHPLRMMRGGKQDAPDRHRTMRSAIEWSYHLLSEHEQVLFRRLPVFVGGFTLRAAEAVCNEAGDVSVDEDHPLAIDVLLSMEALVEKNLVYKLERKADADRRLAMLETVREYAWEQLEESGAGLAQATQRRHADYYLALAEQIGQVAAGPEAAALAERLHAEQDNLRAALRWLLEQDVPDGSEDALRMILAAREFWHQHTHVSELRGWLERALAQAGPRATSRRAMGLRAASMVARLQGDHGAATALGEEALATAREAGDEYEAAGALNVLGGVALMQGDYDTARTLSEEALAKYRELGAARDVAGTLNNLGMGAMYRGDYRRAEEMYRESWAMTLELGDTVGSLNPLTNMGYAIFHAGDAPRARVAFVEALVLALDSDSRRSAARVLSGLGGAMLEGADPRGTAQAVRLLGASGAMREQGGGNLDPLARDDFEQAVATARERLGEEAFDAAWEEGRALSLEQTAEIATREYGREDVGSTAGPKAREKKKAPGGLTAREAEVTGLVARGLSNQAIAGELVLSERTVEMHVSNALHKLGLTTRTQLAAWALENGLAPRSAPN
jgi:non-specific serine/threonine protein kinase